MRVLHVVRQFHPAVGGLENVVQQLSSAQRAAGIDAEVMTLNRQFCAPEYFLPERDVVSGVPVRRIPYTGSRRYPIAPSIVGLLGDFDLVHVHGVDFFCDYLSWTRRIHGKPLVLSTHGGFFHTGFARLLKPLYFHTVTRSALRRYSRVFASSEADADLFRPVAGDRLRMIANAVDTKKFAGASSPGFKCSLAAIGRFASHKGLERLIETFEHVQGHLPGARLTLFGSDWDGTEARLRRIGANAIDAGYLRIRTGLSDSEISRELAECSYFVSASEYEGFGLSLVEALSAGLVPIVNRISSFQTILAVAKIGQLTDFSHPERAAADLASFIVETRPHYRELRDRAQAASEPHSWTHVEKRFRNEYEQVLGIAKRTILGVNFQPMSKSAAVDCIDEKIGRTEVVRLAFANAHTLNVASRDDHYRQALSGFLVLNDGIGLDVASRMKFGHVFPDNLNGTDFVPHYLNTTRYPLRIYLVGARPEVVSQAARTFSDRWPRHRIVDAHHGYFASEEAILKTCRDIREARVHVVLVALGNPLQELWIAKYGPATGARLLVGVGALFDFASGNVPRAPLWLRRLGCEWIFRLVREPRRLFSRYVIGNVIFLRSVLRERRGEFAP